MGDAHRQHVAAAAVAGSAPQAIARVAIEHATTATHSGDLDMTYHFYYSGGEGQSIIEIRNGSDLVLKQHVWANLAGGYVDELIENDVNADPTDGSEQDCELRGWACQDANYNVIGFVDDDLAVLERYEYTPYGQRVVFYNAGSNDPLAHTPTLIPRRVELSGTEQAYGAYAIGHQGLYHDEETASGAGAEATLVYNRARMLHTRLGRFTQRDPLGYVDGMSGYEPYRNSPSINTDPVGLVSIGEVYIAQGDVWVVTGLHQGKHISKENDFRAFYDTKRPLPDCPENGHGWNNEDRDFILQTYIGPTYLAASYQYKWSTVIGLIPGNSAANTILNGIAAAYSGTGLLYFDADVTVDVEKRRYRCECSKNDWQIAYVAGPVKRNQPYFSYRETWNATIYSPGTIMPPVKWYPGGGSGIGGGGFSI